MKKLIYFLPAIVLLGYGCANIPAPAPARLTSGNFSGQFRLVHTHARTGVRDTSKANISLSLDLTTGYKVTGDTTTLIAGSYGGYAVAASYISFNDVTYPKTGIPLKTHLNGTYTYTYDGSALQMVFNNAQDTLSYQYDLKKVN